MIRITPGRGFSNCPVNSTTTLPQLCSFRRSRFLALSPAPDLPPPRSNLPAFPDRWDRRRTCRGGFAESPACHSPPPLPCRRQQSLRHAPSPNPLALAEIALAAFALVS